MLAENTSLSFEILVYINKLTIHKFCSSHAITSDINLEETAKAAQFFLSDGVIITGTATGDPVNPKDLQCK